MKALKAVIELDVSEYGTVQAEKLLRVFSSFFRECTTFKGDMRGYIAYDTSEESPAMSPEELEAIKASCDWRSTVGRLLAHIDSQAAQIKNLERIKGNYCAEIRQLRKSAADVAETHNEFFDSLNKQIEALKDKLAEERAKILMAGEDEVAEAWEYLKDNPNFINDAYQQLKADPDLKKAGVEWE